MLVFQFGGVIRLEDFKMGEFHVVYSFTGRVCLDEIAAAHAVVHAMEKFKTVDLKDERVLKEAVEDLGGDWDRESLLVILEDCTFSQEVVGWYDYEYDGRVWTIAECNGQLGVDGVGFFNHFESALEAIKEKVREDDEALARQKAEEYRDWCRSGKD